MIELATKSTVYIAAFITLRLARSVHSEHLEKHWTVLIFSAIFSLRV
jgi:hypothetical protein